MVNLRRTFFATLSVLLIFTSVAFAQSKSNDGQEVVATIDGEPITAAQCQMVQGTYEYIASINKETTTRGATPVTLDKVIVTNIVEILCDKYQIALSPDEEQSVLAIDRTFGLLIERSSSDNKNVVDREMAQDVMEQYQSLCDLCDTTLEEYRAYCLWVSELNYKMNRLVETQFNGDSSTLMNYIEENYEEFSVIIK